MGTSSTPARSGSKPPTHMRQLQPQWLLQVELNGHRITETRLTPTTAEQTRHVSGLFWRIHSGRRLYKDHLFQSAASSPLSKLGIDPAAAASITARATCEGAHDPRVKLGIAILFRVFTLAYQAPITPGKQPTCHRLSWRRPSN